MLVVGTRVASMRVVYAMAVLPLAKSRAGELLHVTLQRRSFFIRWWYRVDTGGTTADEEQVLFAGAIVGKKKLQLWSPCGREKLPYHTIPYHTICQQGFRTTLRLPAGHDTYGFKDALI